MAWARDRGLAVNNEVIDRMVQRQEELTSTSSFVNRCYQLDRPVPVPPRFFGYTLWGLSALGYPASDSIEASIWYLAATQQADGRWSTSEGRPPMGNSDFIATLLAMQSLQMYPIHGREEEFRRRVEHAAKWFANSTPLTHQDRVCQLLGLGWAGYEAEALPHLVETLVQDQNDDGGWSQLPHLNSDAWATGQTLVALHVAGGMQNREPVLSTRSTVPLEYAIRRRIVVRQGTLLSIPAALRKRLSAWPRPMDFGLLPRLGLLCR